MDNIYYIYIHRKLDTNEIFYVGKGKNNRAYSKKNRNNYWENIAKNGYLIEILYTNLLESDAYLKEIELIKSLKPVANLTKGGEGGNTFELLPNIDKEKFIEESKQRAQKEDCGVQVAAKLRKGKTKDTDSGLKRMAEYHSKNYSGTGNPMYGKSHWYNKTEDENQIIKDKVSNSLKVSYKNKPRKYEIITCPHCGKSGGKPGLTRYHFNNCKSK
jgi:hypothetical protein